MEKKTQERKEFIAWISRGDPFEVCGIFFLGYFTHTSFCFSQEKLRIYFILGVVFLKERLISC